MGINNFLSVGAAAEEAGIRVGFHERSYDISYPREIWKAVPSSARDLLVDNIALASVLHLPMVYPETRGVELNTVRPLFEPYFFRNFVGDIPSCCDMDGNSIITDIERFLNLEYRFSPGAVRIPEIWPAPEKREAGALVPLTFGKDSLLSFAVAEEIGLKPKAVFVDEPSFGRERGYKEELGSRFESEFGHRLEILDHETGRLRDAAHLGVPLGEYGWGLQSTEYALLMLPFARYWGAGYLFFGNEQTAGTTYRDKEGRWTVHPCFDQSHQWTLHIDSMTSLLTIPEPVRTGSLIEPLMDMMIQGILVRRYPKYADLQMSCFVEDEGGRESRWCHNCTICAKMYLMCAGAGVDPAAVGFRRSMLTEKQRDFFALFGGSSPFPYARTAEARDEQLFAFHCAARFGFDDPLVKEFKASRAGEEAARREEELMDRFVSLHSYDTVPAELRDSVFRIYSEELAAFKRRYEAA